ncbi:murein L,D-transpeptidase catalytic domain family protein [Chitinophaga rhizosphaerae]|uniref:murein L,D-transpeptidase catalytic domain family protein n=1 Tax=Chitinophaga rhizosphaerae TaxID=1864947 RepID=UPI000F805C2F|nr:murein L,D-transpeptidase catalytic domain family protein [Chitinophaga rhizosphaerae]
MKKRLSKKIFILPFVVLTSLLTLNVSSIGKKNGGVVKPVKLHAAASAAKMYDSLGLETAGLSRQAFERAMTGYRKLVSEGKVQKDNIISIIDFSLPSTSKRLFVIDLEEGKVLFNTLVSHGRNSGKAMATSFSNRPESYKSSLGFYVTRDTYQGQHGYSLRLEGTELGINDKAMERGIVMHAADYVNDKLGKAQGYIGRSLGCPAVPVNVHKKIIGSIRNGTCLFIYSPDRKYLASSRVLQPAA